MADFLRLSVENRDGVSIHSHGIYASDDHHSDLPRDQLALSEGHDQGVHSFIAQGSVEKSLQDIPMTDGIVGHQQPSPDHLGNECLVTLQVVLLFGIEETEGNIDVVAQMLPSVTGDQLHNVLDTSEPDGLPGQASLILEHLECGQSPPEISTGQGQPEGGISPTGANLQVRSWWSTGSQKGQKLPGLRRYLTESAQQSGAILPILGIHALQVVHSLQNFRWDGMKHRMPILPGEPNEKRHQGHLAHSAMVMRYPLARPHWEPSPDQNTLLHRTMISHGQSVKINARAHLLGIPLDGV